MSTAIVMVLGPTRPAHFMKDWRPSRHSSKGMHAPLAIWRAFSVESTSLRARRRGLRRTSRCSNVSRRRSASSRLDKVACGAAPLQTEPSARSVAAVFRCKFVGDIVDCTRPLSQVRLLHVHPDSSPPVTLVRYPIGLSSRHPPCASVA